MLWIMTVMGMMSLVSIQGMHHVCEGTKRERAGPSGTVEIRSNCNLTLYEIASRIRIRIRARPCSRLPPPIMINNVSHCPDANSRDTYVDTNSPGIVITAGEVQPFVIKYFDDSEYGRHHVCDGTENNVAGITGTVEVRGNCNLTITAQFSKISIIGARPCKEFQQLKINSVPYCSDANRTASYIQTNHIGFVITAENAIPFEIEYSHVSASGSHHICEGAKQEIAGPSGTVEVRRHCQLTLYEIAGRFNILRARPCKGPETRHHFKIDDVSYCPDPNSTDLYIDTNGYGLLIEGKDVDTFEMEFIRGKQHTCIILHKKE